MFKFTQWLSAATLSLWAVAIPVKAAPQDYYGGPPTPAAKTVQKHFQCDETKTSPGFETCKTKINIGRGMGLADMRVSVRHHSSTGGGVGSYIFDVKRQLIRDTSFRGVVGLAGFFGSDIAETLNTRDNYNAYLKGQDVFEAGGLLFEVRDSSRFKLTVFRKGDPDARPFSLSDLEPDENSCTQTNGVKGWDALWSDKRATIRPAFKPMAAEYTLASGELNIGKGDVSVNFIPPSGPTGGEYVTLFVDGQAVFQSQWVKKSEPTCCSYSIRDRLPRDTLFAMANHETGIIMLSSDQGGKYVISTAQFDLANIGKAADMAIGGRFERSTAKAAGKCTGF